MALTTFRGFGHFGDYVHYAMRRHPGTIAHGWNYGRWRNSDILWIWHYGEMTSIGWIDHYGDGSQMEWIAVGTSADSAWGIATMPWGIAMMLGVMQ